MQKPSGRSCGEVEGRLIRWSVYYCSPEPSTASGSFCFLCLCWVQWRERQNDRCALLLSFLLILFLFVPYFSPNRPYAGIFFVFVFFCACNRYLFLISAYGVPLAIAAFPLLSDLLASHQQDLSFILFCFPFLFPFFFFICAMHLTFPWSVLFRCVLAPGTRALNLLCLDEFRRLGNLCITVCDGRFVSL